MHLFGAITFRSFEEKKSETIKNRAFVFENLQNIEKQ